MSALSRCLFGVTAGPAWAASIERATDIGGDFLYRKSDPPGQLIEHVFG